MAEAVLSTEKPCLAAHATHFVAVLNALLKNWKEKSSDAARAVLCEAYRQTHEICTIEIRTTVRNMYYTYYSLNTYYCSISTILKAMALEQDASSRSENVYASCRKRD